MSSKFTVINQSGGKIGQVGDRYGLSLAEVNALIGAAQRNQNFVEVIIDPSAPSAEKSRAKKALLTAAGIGRDLAIGVVSAIIAGGRVG